MPSKPQQRQHSTSRTVKEKALSPRASLHFRDKIKPELPIRPPRADAIRQQEPAGKSADKKGELVKHMSSLPGFLQRADNPQDKILNFGVLDWESLEKWKHTQRRSSGQSRAGDSYAGSSSKVSSIASDTSRIEILSRQNHASCSNVYSSERVTSCLDEQKRESRKDKSYVRGTPKKRSHKTKEMEMSSSKLSTHEKTVEKCNEVESDHAHMRHHKKKDSVILLLPKDFSRSGGLDEFKYASVDGDSAELNWNSFSDVFSIEELHLEESTSDVPHSCPLPFMAGTEAELDMNLDRLIHDQRMRLPSDQPKSAHLNRKLSVSFDVQCEGNNKEELTSLTRSTTSNRLDRKSSQKSNSTAREPSLARQFSLGIGRLSRSISFREGSTLLDSSTDNTVNTTGRSRIGPFRKLLDPIFKSKAAKPVNLVDSSLLYMENISIKGMKDGPAIQSEKSGSTVIQAVLQRTVKSGLPLFKFLVETNNEILASTVKRLCPLRKDDPSWLYSFYSVQEVKRKGGGWRYQGNKGKSSDLSYNVIGQMKVSESMHFGNEDNLKEKITSESVLYCTDPSKVGDESAVKRELGAIVVKMPKEVSKDSQRKNDENTTIEIIIPGSIVVILPSALHSLPSEGVPASLINRWRTGGLCDCGGWDVGCKLQVLTHQDQDDKLLKSSGAYPFRHHCNLFLQGAETENRPTFRLLAHTDGVYLVEYDSAISSLQAFAISVAVLSNQKQPSLSAADSYSSRGRKGHYRSQSCIVQGEGTRYAAYPPHSPVSRA